jgi:RimJ/RimL family protein N-acetyltransferase
MKLLPIDTRELMELVAGWLAEKENYQWLDFGDGRQIVTPPLLKIMLQRDSHFLRVYTNEAGDPVGVTALNSVNRDFKTATFWGLAGNKSFRNRGYGTLAGSSFLTLAFRELNLHAINTWAVENNPSRKLIERLNFRTIGRQRQCHYIDGRAYDRVFYDLLESEHKERARQPPQTEKLGYAPATTST